MGRAWFVQSSFGGTRQRPLAGAARRIASDTRGASVGNAAALASFLLGATAYSFAVASWAKAFSKDLACSTGTQLTMIWKAKLHFMALRLELIWEMMKQRIA